MRIIRLHFAGRLLQSTALLLALTLWSWFLTPIAMGQDAKPEGGRPGKREKPGQKPNAATSLSGPRIAVSLPSYMTQQEVARFGEMLDLAEGQKAFLEHQFEQYKQASGELTDQQMPAVDRAAQEAAAAMA